MGEREAILVIDDDPEVALLLSEFLEREGYPVVVARTGAEGLERVRRLPFALVLLDLEIPDIEGAVIMRQAERLEMPPEVIVVTAHATLDSAIQAVERRNAGYIVKPIDLTRLGAIVARVFERRRLAQENTRLQAEVAERLSESEALAAISATVSSTLDSREALRRICRELARLLGADTTAAYLHDLAAGQLIPTAAYHVPKEYLATLGSAPLPLKGQGFFLPIWEERRPVYSDDVARDARFTHAMFRSFPHQSGLLLPLIVDDQVVGGFYVVWWTARRRFTDRELRALEHVCEQVGFFLRNARLYERAERDRHQLEALNEVSRRLAAVNDPEEVLTVIVNEAARLVKAEAAGLRLLEGDDLVISARTESALAVMARPRMKIGESLSGLVVATGTPVVVEDLAADTRYDPDHKRGALEQGFLGFIGVPLRAHGVVVGTLNVFTRGVRHFLPDDVALLSALADQAALANEKARFIRESEQGRVMLERLYGAATTMQSSWERDDRLAAFVRAAREVVGFDRVNVFLLNSDGSELELVTTAGDADAPELRLPATREAGPYHEALTTRRPIAVLSDDDLGRVSPLAGAHLDHPYLRSRRFVVAPLIVGDRVIGVVSADNKPTRRPIDRQSLGPFSSLCQNLAIALEESRLYAEARAREQEATRLYAVTRQLATSLDREQLLDVIAEQARFATGCDAVGIFFYDVTRDALVFHRGLHLAPELTQGLALRPGEGIAGRAYQERQPVWTRDRLTDPTLRHSPAAQRIVDAAAPRAYLGVPITSREETHGVLVVYFFEPHDFTAHDIQFVSTLADHAAVVLQNARLFEATQRREREAKTLSDGLALLNQAARALHRTLEVDAMLDGALKELARAFAASGALVHLLAEDGRVSRSVGHWVSGGRGPGEPGRAGGITDHVRRTRVPLLLRDVTQHADFVHPANVAHGVRSIGAFPIVGQSERVLGVLILYYTTTQAFGDTETHLLGSYADQLATALENASLYHETQTQRVRFAQIFDSTSDGIVLVGRAGEVRAANRQAGELLGFEASAAIGVRLADLLGAYRSAGPGADRLFANLLALLNEPERGGEGDLELRRTGRTVHWTGQPTKDAAGRTIGFTLTLRDVTHERQVSQMKTDFVSFVTHQLRTPLAGIKWMLELASQTPRVPSEAASYVEDARAAAERLIGLVNDLLDISRLESGKLAVTLEPTNLATLTGTVLEDLGTLLREKRHHLSVTGADTVPLVLADLQLLRQVVLNLTSNAIKYTPAGGAVSIRMTRDDDRTARWTIADSGIGIPKAALGKLFEKFFRADNVHTVETEGTGLGLYLVRLIIERFGGQVWCEAEEGRGSTFIFTLPTSG
jgi:PAS domain S-box-containing protein